MNYRLSTLWNYKLTLLTYNSTLYLCFLEINSYGENVQVLLLHYQTEIDENSREVLEKLLVDPVIKKAVTALEESAFTPAQLLGYEKFWDIIAQRRR